MGKIVYVVFDLVSCRVCDVYSSMLTAIEDMMTKLTEWYDWTSEEQEEYRSALERNGEIEDICIILRRKVI